MPEHFTHNTIEASFWCKPCGKPTMHYVANGRRGGCQACIAKREAEIAAEKAKPKAPEQVSLFEEVA